MDERATQELSNRIKELEEKVDILVAQMHQAMGAWLFVKLLGGFALGLTMVWTFITDLFKFKS